MQSCETRLTNYFYLLKAWKAYKIKWSFCQYGFNSDAWPRCSQGMLTIFILFFWFDCIFACQVFHDECLNNIRNFMVNCLGKPLGFERQHIKPIFTNVSVLGTRPVSFFSLYKVVWQSRWVRTLHFEWFVLDSADCLGTVCGILNSVGFPLVMEWELSAFSLLLPLPPP